MNVGAFSFLFLFIYLFRGVGAGDSWHILWFWYISFVDLEFVFEQGYMFYFYFFEDLRYIWACVYVCIWIEMQAFEFHDMGFELGWVFSKKDISFEVINGSWADM